MEDRLLIASKVLLILEEEGYEAFFVGGSVRDYLMQRTPHDIDIATNAHPEQLLKVAKKHKIRTWYSQNGIQHGTIVFQLSDYDVEITTYRFDVSCDGRNATIQFANNVKDDLARRDFTINAMAMDKFGKIEDYFGGVNDLERKIIRFVGDPNERILEDKLRMLRAVRFAVQFGFHLHHSTKRAIERNSNKVHSLSWERIRDELIKMLNIPQPSKAIRLLDRVGLLKEILPEIVKMQGVEQREDYHHKDAYEHTLLVLDHMAELTTDPFLRLAALFHDIGKPETKSFTPGIGFQFIEHEIKGAEIAMEICKRFHLSSFENKMICRLVREHLRLTQLTTDNNANARTLRRLLAHFAKDYDEQGFGNFYEWLVMLTRADMTSHIPEKINENEKKLEELLKRIEEVRSEKPLPKPPLNGHEVMDIFGIPESIQVGEIMSLLQNAVIDGELKPDDKEGAISYIKRSGYG